MRWTAGFALAVGLIAAAGGVAWAGFSGFVRNSTGTFSTGTMLLEGTTPTSVTCTSSSTLAQITTNSATCAGDPLPVGTLSTSAASATSTLSDPGTVNPTRATLSSPTCGVEEIADAAGNDTGLAMGGFTYSQPGPLGGSAIAFDGSTGWSESTASWSSPSSFTLLAWFKAAAGATGTIFSVSNSQFDTGATTSDLNLWVNSSGKLVWGIDTLNVLVTLQSEVTGTTVVTDGKWHLATATFSGLTSTLYLDGASQGSLLAVTGLGSYSGHPSVGWGPVGSTGWSGAPTSAFFGGSLAMVSVSPSALSAANVATLAAETTTSGYESALSTDAAPSENWKMADSGTTPFTGTVNVSGGGTTTPCQRVEITVQQVQGVSTSCAVPAGSGSCPAPASSTLLTSLVTPAALDVPGTSTSVQLSVSFALTASSPVGVAGLHVLPDLTFKSARTGWSAALSYLAASAQL